MKHIGTICRHLRRLAWMPALTLAFIFSSPLQGAQSVTLAWDPNPENDIAGYILYYGRSSGNYTNATNVGNNTTNTVSGLNSAVTYYFVVTAYNTSSLESDPSIEISYTVPPAQANTPPVISALSDRITSKNTPTPAIAFTVGDVETPAANLLLSVVSSNPWLVPNGAMVLGGSGTNRTLTVSPATNQTGTASITVSVSDGAATATSTFTLQVIGDGLDAWHLVNFSPSDLADPSKEATVWGDKADPDHDGLENLLEFALGLNPGQRESSQLGVASSLVDMVGQKHLRISYKHRTIEPLLQYIPEVSLDKQTWNSGAGIVAETGRIPLSAGFEMITVQDLTPVSLQSPRFIRLKVIKN